MNSQLTFGFYNGFNRNREICELYRKGKPLRKISEALNVPVGTVGTVVRKFEISNRSVHLNDHRRAIISQMTHGFSVSEVAKKAGCCKNTAHRYLQWYRRREEQRLKDSGAPMPLNRPKTCPIHGKISVWPCVACSAEKALKSKKHTAKN